MLQLNDTIILIQNIGPLNVGAICKILAFADGDSYSTAKMVLLAVPKNQGVSWYLNNSLKINNDYISRTRFAQDYNIIIKNYEFIYFRLRF